MRQIGQVQKLLGLQQSLNVLRLKLLESTQRVQEKKQKTSVLQTRQSEQPTKALE